MGLSTVGTPRDFASYRIFRMKISLKNSALLELYLACRKVGLPIPCSISVSVKTFIRQRRRPSRAISSRFKPI